jgi:hypothetical protein
MCKFQAARPSYTHAQVRMLLLPIRPPVLSSCRLHLSLSRQEPTPKPRTAKDSDCHFESKRQICYLGALAATLGHGFHTLIDMSAFAAGWEMGATGTRVIDLNQGFWSRFSQLARAVAKDRSRPSSTAGAGKVASGRPSRRLRRRTRTGRCAGRPASARFRRPGAWDHI